MAAEWEQLTLGDLGRIVTGKTPPGSVLGSFGGDIPFVTPSDMDGRKTIARTERYLTDAGAATVQASRLPAGAVMVSCIGSDMGKTAIAGRECVTNQQINSIIVQDRFNRDFVYYNLRTRKNELRYQAAGGSAQPILNKRDFSRLQIALPPLPEQKAIAAVLGALDDKIELNRRMNATLEAMAQALFQSWFVDFDPVRAKLDGRQPTGLDSATAALFPSEFEDSALGPIAKGWTVGRVGDILTFSRSTLDPARFPAEYFAHYSLPAFDEGRRPKLEVGSAIKSHKLVIPAEAVLLSKLNPHIPRIWLPDLTAGQRAVCSTEFLVAQPKPGFSREFLFCLFNSGPFAAEYATLVTGTTGSHQRVKSESVLEMKLAIPPPTFVEHFSSLAKPMFEMTALQIRKSGTVASIRDALLPNLLNGHVRPRLQGAVSAELASA